MLLAKKMLRNSHEKESMTLNRFNQIKARRIVLKTWGNLTLIFDILNSASSMHYSAVMIGEVYTIV